MGIGPGPIPTVPLTAPFPVLPPWWTGPTRQEPGTGGPFRMLLERCVRQHFSAHGRLCVARSMALVNLPSYMETLARRFSGLFPPLPATLSIEKEATLSGRTPESRPRRKHTEISQPIRCRRPIEPSFHLICTPSGEGMLYRVLFIDLETTLCQNCETPL
jgi:hypothetical protein